MPGVEVILISKDILTPYSGMLPARLAGWYLDHEMHFDLLNLCAQSGVIFLDDEVVKIDRDARVVTLREHPPLVFDFASINVGVTPQLPKGAFGHPRVMAVKPISDLLLKWEAFVKRRPEPGARWVVIGGGAAGFELAMILSFLFQKQNYKGEIWLVHSGNEILANHSRAVRARARALLANAGVNVRLKSEVREISEEELVCASGEKIIFREAVVTTGAKAPGWLAASQLPVNDDGFVIVESSLRVRGVSTVFAVGDCAHFADHPLPKSGVFAVREGPVLIENLRRSVRGEKVLRRYRPQKRVLALLTSGERRAMMSYGPLNLEGAWLWNWKDKIDQKFMRMYGHFDAQPMAATENTCGGCGGKLPAQDLQALLTELKKDKRFPLPSEIEDVGSVGDVVTSIDGFRSFTSDLFLFGQVATWHSLNDFYASGIRPLGASVYVGLPEASTHLRRNRLQQLMSGVLLALAEAEAPLLNAHSAEAAETSLVVAPVARGEALWKKSGLRKGDVLILTKAIGTGSLLQAMMNGALPPEAWSGLKRALLQHHSLLIDKLREFAIIGCTDISGFGLIGHLCEMAEASQVAVELNVAAIPQLNGFSQVSAKGFRSFLAEQNQLAFAKFVRGSVDSPVLWDPQTHGPLLVSVNEAHAEKLLKILVASGFDEAARVGFVAESVLPEIRLRAK